ncbi:MAG: glycoside hydrolase [Chromatiales bacterium]|nr:glycoside hydrolase [Chromatiales bacterium]PLX55451.1 MAG: hypothetical protein C0629_12510 [Chromatiales bacterium]
MQLSQQNITVATAWQGPGSQVAVLRDAARDFERPVIEVMTNTKLTSPGFAPVGVFSVIGAVLWLWSALAVSAPESTGKLKFALLQDPAGPGARTPHLAVDGTGGVLLSWLEPDADRKNWRLKYSRYHSGAWQTPRVVAGGDSWFVNWADFPSVVALSQQRLAAHWLAKRDGGVYAYDVMISQSLDDGKSWSPPASPHDDGTSTEHGFVSLFPWRGEAGVIWLDGRETQSVGEQTGAPGHSGHHGGMTLRYGLLDADNAALEESLVDGLVCDCCQTDAAVAGDQALIVYRNRTDREIRDIFFTRMGPRGWSDPQPVANDDWEMPACPVNGPALDMTADTAAVAWFTAAQGNARVQVAFSDATGFAAPAVIDANDPLGRVDIVLIDDHTAVVSWLGAAERDGRAALRVAFVDRETGKLAELSLHSLAASRLAGFPQAARSTGGLLFAWTEPEEPSRIRTGFLAIPDGYLDSLR